MACSATSHPLAKGIHKPDWLEEEESVLVSAGTTCKLVPGLSLAKPECGPYSALKPWTHTTVVFPGLESSCC